MTLRERLEFIFDQEIYDYDLLMPKELAAAIADRLEKLGWPSAPASMSTRENATSKKAKKTRLPG